MRLVPAVGEGGTFGAGAGLGEGVVPFIECDRSVDGAERNGFGVFRDEGIGDGNPGDW